MEQIHFFQAHIEKNGSADSAADYDLNGLTIEDLKRDFGISITRIKDKDTNLAKGFFFDHNKKTLFSDFIK